MKLIYGPHRSKKLHTAITKVEPLFSAQQMYWEALEPFSANHGTPYPCSQDTIDFHALKEFPHPNITQFISPSDATTDMLRQNSKRRVPPPAESEAIQRLYNAALDEEDGHDHGPDLAIKAFDDLDTVFFGGYLRRNVRVQWVASIKKAGDDDYEAFGETRWERSASHCQCTIVLDAEMIFLSDNGPNCPSSFRLMLSTLLHEMTHAYENFRCARRYIDDDGHDQHFGTRISCVHDRAMAILGGVPALDVGEGYKQWHYLLDEGAGCCVEAKRRLRVGTFLRNIAERCERKPSDVVGFKRQVEGRRNFTISSEFVGNGTEAGAKCVVM